MDIVLWNQSSDPRFDDSAGQLIADACDLQMREDVAPAYGLRPSPRVSFLPRAVKREELPGDCLVIIFAKDSDEAEAAAGFMAPPSPTTRDRDTRRRNFARVYPETILDSKGSVLDGARSISAATSHECIEATYDRNVALWVWNERDCQLVAGEVCDPVEEDAYTKFVRGQDAAVSNFVYPAWFDAQAPEGSRFDHMRRLDKAFSCSEGGYLYFYDPAEARDPKKPGDGFHIQAEPPGPAPQWGWEVKDKENGFARTRLRPVWSNL
jgi:hypothetical protein